MRRMGPSEEEQVEFGPMLGRGSFGRVYKGRWKNVLVAIKARPVPSIAFAAYWGAVGTEQSSAAGDLNLRRFPPLSSCRCGDPSAGHKHPPHSVLRVSRVHHDRACSGTHAPPCTVQLKRTHPCCS